MIFEMLFCVLTTPPGMNTTISGTMMDGTFNYSLEALIGVICLGKSYLFIRVY